MAADSVNGGYLVVADRDVSGNHNVYARQVTTAGVPTGSAIGVAATLTTEQDPDVAFGAALEEYLVVWEQGSDLYARRVESDGTLNGSAFAVVTATGAQADPALDYGPSTSSGQGADSDAFLVTWSDGNDAFGQRVASDAGLLGAPITLANATNNQTVPDVGYNALTADWLAVSLALARRASGCDGGAYGYGQVVHEDGRLSGNNQTLTPDVLAERIAASAGGEPSGNQSVVWANGSNTAILARRFRPLQAGFTATPTQGVISLTVQFTTTATPAGVADPLALPCHGK